MASEKPVSVLAGLAANVGIAVTKFVAAAITGSAAMLAEAIHSLVDSGNSGLLLLGKRLSSRPPDELHPFGHGKDLYFWTLVVSMSVFTLGGGVTILEGVERVLAPEMPKKPIWNYVVFGVAAAMEAFSCTVAYRQLAKTRDGRSLWETIRQSKDPTDFFVLLEDGAALLGVGIAFLGVLLAQLLHQPIFDGIASVLIGATLAVVAVFLAYECRGLLLGEAVHKEVAESVRELVRADPAVQEVGMPMTMHLGPDEVLLNLDLKFHHDGTGGLEAAIDRLEKAIRQKHPVIKRIYLEVEGLETREPQPSPAP